MIQEEIRPYSEILGGHHLKLVRDRTGYRWRWNGTLYSAHEFLEIRPGTPRVAGDQLAFVARDGDRWSVHWGLECLTEADDAFDLDSFRSVPVFVSRDGGVWRVHLGKRVIASETYQLTYRIAGDTLAAYAFPRFGSTPIFQVEPGDDLGDAVVG